MAQDSVFPAYVTGTPASPDIAWDTGDHADQTSGASLTKSLAAAADANFVALFVASYLSGGGQTHTATWNGTSMTSAGSVTNGNDKFELFYLTSASGGTHDFVLTPSSSSCEVAIVVASLKNVASVSNYSTGSGASYPYSVTVSANTGSWALAGLGAYNRTVDIVSNGTERVTNENGATQNSCWLFTLTNAGTIDGELSGSVDWRMLGIRLNK